MPQYVPQPPPSFYLLSLFFCLLMLLSHSLLPLPISLPFFLSSSFLIFLLLASFLLLCLSSFPLFASLPSSLLFSSASLSSHPTESHPSSLGRHMCCFDSKGSDRARGRKAATPWQQRHIIGGKTHPIINYWIHPTPPTLCILAIVTAVWLSDQPSPERCLISLLSLFSISQRRGEYVW